MSTSPLLGQPPSAAPASRRDPRPTWTLRPWVLLGAVACAVLAWITQAVFVQSARGQAWDDGWRVDIQAVAGPVWSARAHDFGVLSLRVALLACVVLVAVTLVRRRVDLLVRGAVLVAGANATTQLLKHAVIDRPGYVGFGPNALPSGHVTLVASVVVAAAIALPLALRPLVVSAGIAWTAAVAIGTIVAGWHRPSDLVAALLVCVGWAALVATVVRRIDSPGRFMSA